MRPLVSRLRDLGNMIRPLLIDRAAETLCRGGIIAYPTEGVWGLGVDPFDRHAVAALTALKGRSPAQGYIVVAADIAQVEPFMAPLQPDIRAQMVASWPGPVTWVVPVKELFPRWVTGRFASVAVRVSAHPVIAELCRAFGGPIVSTSANPHRLAPARDAFKVRRYFGNRVDCIVHGKLGGQPGPTEIRDALTGRVLRSAN